MAEIRQNMATKEWVIIATERARRSDEFADWSGPQRTEDLPERDPDCPFCPGNEEGPDTEVLRIPEDGPWQLRVVKNKYPALSREGERQRRFDGVYRWISAVGYHEVVIEARQHNTSPALEPARTLARTLLAFQKRGEAMARDPRVEHIIYFKNHGPRAGTSLLHPHCQIIGLPMVPFHVRSRNEEARRYFDDTGECVHCAMLREELRVQERIVAESAGFVAFLPYAAYSPFHIWLMPREHGSTFLSVPNTLLRDLAGMLRVVLRKLHFGLNDPGWFRIG